MYKLEDQTPQEPPRIVTGRTKFDGFEYLHAMKKLDEEEERVVVAEIERHILDAAFSNAIQICGGRREGFDIPASAFYLLTTNEGLNDKISKVQ